MDFEQMTETDRNHTNRCAAIQLANKIPSQALELLIDGLKYKRRALESLLPTFLPEQAQEAEIEIEQCAERRALYYQIWLSRGLGISR